MGLVGAYSDAEIREEIVELLWKNVAFCTRYGHADLDTVLRLPPTHLGGYMDAINELLEEEKPKT